MRFQRGGDIREVNGEAGNGVYAYIIPNNAMKRYYTAHGEPIYDIIPKDQSTFLDFTDSNMLKNLISYMNEYVSKEAVRMQQYTSVRINKSNYQRFGNIIECYVGKNFPNADGWIVQHKGAGIPQGKQVVIRNINATEIQKVG